MSGRQVCAKCHAELGSAARFCAVCGTPRSRVASGGWIVRSLAAVAVLLFAILIGVIVWKARLSASKDIHIDAELQSGVDRPALELPGVMRVMYVDEGRSIQLSIVSKSNPILYVDMDQDHTLSKGDVSYAALPGNRVCVAAIDPADNPGCSAVGSSATVLVTQAGDVKTVTWKIPKSELGRGKKSADIVIRTFHENTQQGEYYPAEPFGKVYRLVYLQRATRTAAAEAVRSRRS